MPLDGGPKGNDRMEGEDKTKVQLVNELKELRKRINDLEASEEGRKRAGEALKNRILF